MCLRTASGYTHASTLFSKGDLAVALERHQPEVTGGQLRREGHGRHTRWSWHEGPGREPTAERSQAPNQPHEQHHRPAPPTSRHGDPPLHTHVVAAKLQPEHGQQSPAAPPCTPGSAWWLLRGVGQLPNQPYQPWPPRLRRDGFLLVPAGDEDLDIGPNL